MSTGYIYILSNPAMPGLLKIGRTDRRPETRATELSTTGVPSKFVVEFSILVTDSVAAERYVHQTLESRGCRHSENREFFRITIEEASEVARSASVEIPENENSTLSTSSFAILSVRYNSIPKPGYYESISEERAEKLESEIFAIANAGHIYAYKTLANLFTNNFPNSLKYRRYWLDYMDLSFRKIKHEWSNQSMSGRQEVGQAAADYLETLLLQRWIGNHDFDNIQRFIISTDSYTYEGFVNAVKRSEFPESIRARSLAL